MRICNIGHARSRTTILTRTVANFYNIEFLGEIYHQYKTTVLPKKYFQDIEQSQFNTYRQKIQNFTDSLFIKDNFIIKLWPRWMNSTKCITSSNNFIMDINNVFKISLYDKIIVTKRNSLDSLCSFWLAENLGFTFIFDSKNQIDKQNSKYYIDKKVNGNYYIQDFTSNLWYRSFIKEIMLIDKLCIYMDQKKISYDLVSYEEVIQYLSSNYFIEPAKPLENLLPVDTKINYNEVIRNYNDVEEMVNFIEKDIKKDLDNFSFY